MSIGVVFASTGGNKIARCIRSFRRMEPDLFPLHIVFDIGSRSWRARNQMAQAWVETRPYVKVKHFAENKAHINGILNSGLRWMKEIGCTHAALFHDDLIFSPLPEHQGSLSMWFDHSLVQTSSGIRFAHFETFCSDTDSRRPSEEWDREDLESPEFWRTLANYKKQDGADCRPPGRNFWFKYEGPDYVRPWNRLGPTGQIVPLATWEAVGQFDERDGIFYDGEYPSECYRRRLPPIWAVDNFPYIHLHNQSMNPWLDPAPGGFGNTMAAYERRFGADWPGFWKDDWEQKWREIEKTTSTP